MVEFRIDRRSGVATYMQLVHQVRQALLLGHLELGDQLPAAREVVVQTGINPNTVLKAYRQLAAEGLVETRMGSGTFVTTTPARRVATEESVVGQALRDWLDAARRSGLTRAEVQALFQAGVDDVFP